MYRGLKIMAFAPALNEVGKIDQVVKRVPRKVVDETLIVDDGSTDETAKIAEDLGATVIRLGETVGAGAAIRAGYDYGVKKGYDVVVVMAGNNKDAPEEIPLLVDPIADGKADYVQGSRFLKKNADFGPMPFYRKFATRLHPILCSLIIGRKITESTNGFRAVTRAVLTDPRIDLHQDWLDGYELEIYLFLKVYKLGLKVVEVPVSKVYPPKALGQTKIKPFTDWWAVLKPLVVVALNLKR